jgi:hypothetical protein
VARQIFTERNRSRRAAARLCGHLGRRNDGTHFHSSDRHFDGGLLPLTGSACRGRLGSRGQSIAAAQVSGTSVFRSHDVV